MTFLLKIPVLASGGAGLCPQLALQHRGHKQTGVYFQQAGWCHSSHGLRALVARLALALHWPWQARMTCTSFSCWDSWFSGDSQP